MTAVTAESCVNSASSCSDGCLVRNLFGTADTFHLEEPARLLDQTLKELGIRAQFTYIEGHNHFDLYQGGLGIKMANERAAAAHRKPAKPAVGTKPRPHERKQLSWSQFHDLSNF